MRQDDATKGRAAEKGSGEDFWDTLFPLPLLSELCCGLPAGHTYASPSGVFTRGSPGEALEMSFSALCPLNQNLHGWGRDICKLLGWPSVW